MARAAEVNVGRQAWPWDGGDRDRLAYVLLLLLLLTPTAWLPARHQWHCHMNPSFYVARRIGRKAL